MRKFKYVREEFKKNKDFEIDIPARKTKFSCGYDFQTPVDIVLKPNESSNLIFTDIKAIMNPNEFLMLHIRSSLGMKGVVLRNVTGIIDADYANNKDNDGNIGFMLTNLSDKVIEIKRGDRVMQGVFLNYLIAKENKVQNGRDGGFGSTDI